MIADTAVLTTSPWSGDQMLFQREACKMLSSPDLHTIDMDIAALEAEIEKATCQSEGGELSLGNTSCGNSVTGSECSDDVCIDIESDAEHLFRVSEDGDYFNANLWNLLGTNSDTAMNLGDPLMATDSWDIPIMTSLSDMSGNTTTSDSAVELAQYDSILSVSAPTSPQVQRKKQKNRSSSSSYSNNHLTSAKTWTSLSNSQQVQVIEDLTKIISNEMGLREQMEIIKIINPDAAIASTDTEFVIDLDCLSDEKLLRVRTLVKQHTCTSSCTTSSSVGSSSSSGISDCSSECSSPSQKKQTKRQQRKPREERQRQRKEYRQMLKEKRSGLFRKEEVLALSTTAPEEDEDADIDILL